MKNLDERHPACCTSLSSSLYPFRTALVPIAAGGHDEGHRDRGQRERPWPCNAKRQGRMGKIRTSDEFARARRMHQCSIVGVKAAHGGVA